MVRLSQFFCLCFLCLLGMESWGQTTAVNSPQSATTNPHDTVYLFQGDTIVHVVGSLMFYDNGGRNGNYTPDVHGAVTFVPETGKIIKMKFHNVYNGQTVTNYQTYTGADDLIFYNGYSTNVADKIFSVYGAKKGLKDIISSSPDGAITVQFNPRKNLYGWAIEVMSYDPIPLAVSMIQSTAITSNNVLKGSADQQMLLIKLHVSGEYGVINVKEFALRAESHYVNALDTNSLTTDVQARHVYVTDTISGFSNVDSFGGNSNIASDSIYRISGRYTIVAPGAYKFWVAYDIQPNAINGHHVKAQLLEMVIDGDTIRTFAANSAATRAISSGMEGTYTIGSSASANYPTFKAAVQAMSGGISGKVLFNVESGTYDEMVMIPQINGSSQNNTIKFKSMTGNYQDVVIQKSGYLPRPSGLGSSEDYGTVTVYGADYLEFEGISFKATSNQAKSVVLVTNVSDHFTMNKCYVEAPKSTSYSTQVNCVQIKGKNESYKNCNNSTILNSVFKGGYVGVYVYGTGYVALPKQKGAMISDCKFYEQDFFGIYMTKEHHAQICGNTINISGTIKSGYKAIDAVMVGDIKISNNRIFLDSTATNYAYGIYLRSRDDNETLQGRNQIFNNEIIFDNPRMASSTPIFFADPITHTDIAYNSVLVKNSVQKPALVYLKTYYRSKSNSDVNFINNLFQNATEGPIYDVQNKNYLTTGLFFSNNGYFTQGNRFAADNHDTIANLSAWQNLVGDTASIFAQAQFVSDRSLDLRNGDTFNMGTPRLDITNRDITHLMRHAQRPTVGAYEYGLRMDTIPNFSQGYPIIQNITKNSAEIIVKLDGNGHIAYAIREASLPAPSSIELIDSIKDVRENTEVYLNVSGLASATQYIAYFQRFISPSQKSVITACAPFTTLAMPTEVSTFEGISDTVTGRFTDGTAIFEGFGVVAVSDGQGPNNHKAAKMTDTIATVAINNSRKGLVLNGFLLKSNAQLMLMAMRDTVNTFTKTLAPTGDKWQFINLREADSITSVKLVTKPQSQVMIDNFSGDPQPITFAIADTTVNQYDPICIHTDIYGGVLPYTYSWKNSMREELSTTDSLSIDTVTGANQITLTVTDAWGHRCIQTFLIAAIGGDAEIATFEDLFLEPDSFWQGNVGSDNMYATFYSGSYSFSNVFMETIGVWALFGYSNKTATDYNPENMLTDQFNSLVGHGVDSSQNYAVAYLSPYMGKAEITCTHAPQGDSIKGFYVTNTAWVKYVSEHGTGLNSTGMQDANTPFTTGDFLKLIAKGDNGKTTEFYLVDYRDSVNQANHYLIDSWQWVDLSPLGKVKSVEFSMDGSRQTSNGTNIPTYVCIDNFGADRSVLPRKKIILNIGKDSILNLETLFGTMLPAGADIDYEVTDSCDSNIVQLSLSDSVLTLRPRSEGETHLIISQWVKGQKVFIKLPIKVDPSTNTELLLAEQPIIAYPNPATEGFCLNVSGKVEIFTPNGQQLYLNAHYAAGAFIATAHFEKGVYLVKIGEHVLKLIIK